MFSDTARYLGGAPFPQNPDASRLLTLNRLTTPVCTTSDIAPTTN